MVNEAGGIAAVFGTPVPDVFSDAATMFDISNGTLRISFAVLTPTEAAAPSPVALATIGRLIMPVEGAQRLCLGLYDFLKKMNLDPTALASGGETAQ